MLGDQFYDRRADDDAIGDARDVRRLLGGADAEADRDRDVGLGLEAGDGVLDRGLLRLLEPGDAGDRHIIQEPARAIEHGRQARGVGGGRRETDQVDSGGAQLRAEGVVFLGRYVDADHAVDTGLRGGLGEPVRAAAEHRVAVSHQHQRHVRVARAERGGGRQDVRGAGSLREAADVGRLDRRTVGHRIGERHAELDRIRATCDERVEDRAGGLGGRITRGNERDERGAAGGGGAREGGGEAVQSSPPACGRGWGRGRHSRMSEVRGAIRPSPDPSRKREGSRSAIISPPRALPPR